MENKEIIQFISILLQYPNEEMKAASLLNEIGGISNGNVHASLERFSQYVSNHSLEQLKQNYVHTFDFNEKTNLYLTYSKLKEERERGNILAKLKTIYEDEGFVMDTSELPDYLPLFLEFTSVAKNETVKELVPQLQSTIVELKSELEKIDSPYAELIHATLNIFDEIFANAKEVV